MPKFNPHVSDKESLVALFETIPHPQRLYPDIFMERLMGNGLSLQKQGQWIEDLVPDGYEQKRSRAVKCCSVCGWSNACRYNYCPNCGAKMIKKALAQRGVPLQGTRHCSSVRWSNNIVPPHSMW